MSPMFEYLLLLTESR